MNFPAKLFPISTLFLVAMQIAGCSTASNNEDTDPSATETDEKTINDDAAVSDDTTSLEVSDEVSSWTGCDVFERDIMDLVESMQYYRFSESGLRNFDDRTPPRDDLTICGATALWTTSIVPIGIVSFGVGASPDEEEASDRYSELVAAAEADSSQFIDEPAELSGAWDESHFIHGSYSGDTF
ncbi:hypothetical protein [Glycomyces salinus]|uniref:hypothetical protein n=1 Tax=Glycomyces salinus TaxID=980294 RepID=UPI0018EB1BD8|nr:hypothetical protein [Glycomyces salinus]